jgi:UDP-N-acetylglucosamine diphosphorylase/glucosamine-1-phosphate N-acetyltransferase
MREISFLLFEDEKWNLLRPLSYTRPVYDIRCGILTPKERVKIHFPEIPISLHTRNYLEDIVREENPGVSVNEVKGYPLILINGRLLSSDIIKILLDEKLRGRAIIDKNGDPIALYIESKTERIDSLLKEGPLKKEDILEMVEETIEVNYTLPEYPWDLIHLNERKIKEDFEILGKRGIFGKVYPGVHIISPDGVFIGRNSRIKPGVVLDAEEGPIFIGEGTLLEPNVVIKGPCAIGENSFIKMGSKIGEGTSTGPVTKLGGEVESSIFQGYSNKQHDGFFGHSYVGSWVNVGADSNTSDLKNTYGTVSVDFFGEKINTGHMFLGLIMGDHSKCGINTMFNTGTIVGVAVNVFGGDYPPKFIPSFLWGGTSGWEEHDLDKAIETARRVMERRKVKLTESYKKLLIQIFEITREERKKLL